MAPELYGGADALPVPDPAEHPVARRRNPWTGAEEMRDRFADRAPYSGWVPEVLGDYCTHGLLPVGRSEEHTYELQSLMRISSAVFCLQQQKSRSLVTAT